MPRSSRGLESGGGPHIADFGQPARVMRALAGPLDALAGRLPQLIAEAGFTRVEESARIPTLFGVPIGILHARSRADRQAAAGSRSRRSSSALTATITLEPDIDNAAISGRSTRPKAGSKPPAAMGSAIAL